MIHWPLYRSLRRDFAGVDLRGANLSNLDLGDFNFRAADFTAADLTGSIVQGADFRTAKGLTPEQRADLRKRGAIVDDPPATRSVPLVDTIGDSEWDD